MYSNHPDSLIRAKESQRSFLQEAAHARLVREVKREQSQPKRSLKQQFGEQLIVLGRKIAQETETV